MPLRKHFKTLLAYRYRYTKSGYYTSGFSACCMIMCRNNRIIYMSFSSHIKQELLILYAINTVSNCLPVFWFEYVFQMCDCVYANPQIFLHTMCANVQQMILVNRYVDKLTILINKQNCIYGHLVRLYCVWCDVTQRSIALVDETRTTTSVVLDDLTR